MKQLVVGTAYGYKVEDLKPFVLSLRRHYQGDVLFVTGELDQESVDFLHSHDIIIFKLNEIYQNPWDIAIHRYPIYQEILKRNFLDVERILLTDVRDVIFQDDPFKFSSQTSLDFFHEPATFEVCEYNRNWIANLFGVEELERLKNKLIICVGTTLGTREGIKKYIDVMTNKINELIKKNVPLFFGWDQAIHAHSIYNEMFDDFGIHNNGEGPITTVHHQMTLKVDRQGQLLNNDDAVTPIIHQWDRAGRIKCVLEKTALEGPGPKPSV